MIEIAVLEYLEEETKLPVFMEKLGTIGSTYLVVEKTGSMEVNRIPTTTIAIDCYAPTLLEAAALSETVKDLMFDAVSVNGICSVKLNSDYNSTNTATKEYKYTGVYVITHTQEV